jgi:hypothetical protein
MHMNSQSVYLRNFRNCGPISYYTYSLSVAAIPTIVYAKHMTHVSKPRFNLRSICARLLRLSTGLLREGQLEFKNPEQFLSVRQTVTSYYFRSRHGNPMPQTLLE